MNENIEKCLNLKKVRYEYLDKLLKNIKKENFREGNTINIFIDIPSTVKQLYNPEILKGFSGRIGDKDKYQIASNILNMIGHYRHYFASRHQMYSNFYFMYNSGKDEDLLKIYPDYKKDYYIKRLSTNDNIFGPLNYVLGYNYKMIKTLTSYIPHAYFIDTNNIDHRVIYNYLNDYETISMIITTDKLMYQNLLHGKCMILQPKAEKSNIVRYNSLINEYLKEDDEPITLNPENITLINSLMSHKDYNIKGFKNYGFKKAINFLKKNNIDTDLKIENETGLENILGFLEDDEYQTILRNFNLTNNYLIYSKNKEKLKLIVDSQIVDYEDNKGFRKVNERYFERFPLQTDFIWEGE